MLRRLLIANRGEIACRIIRTARRLGIDTIAVYTTADSHGLHTRLAGEAHALKNSGDDSYLDANAIIAIARAAGADAVHPGYGFLAENASFADACKRAGLVFVGPPADVIAGMGSKNAAKERMRLAGVPVLPGYHGEAQTIAELTAQALLLGFPLMIKPSGGGGGKGMQIVSAPDQLSTALHSAWRVAESAFADPRLLLERYVESPRHVEVQLLCDQFGTAIHLHTRDCSVQRRHQKMIEEAPAPDISAAVREQLHDAALQVAHTVGYQNAGTVEFIYKDGQFWFMEMNTRLQVEHGVTEEIFGLDLVEWQLRIAAGERLTLTQQTLIPRGHAIEVRLCAEDADSDGLPSAGTLAHVSWPTHQADLRVDAGYAEGDVVPTQYDSLLAKVIGVGPTRTEAIRTLDHGLNHCRLVGVTTNAGWLQRALRTASFTAGSVSTGFIAQEQTALARTGDITAIELGVAVLVYLHAPGTVSVEGGFGWGARDGFRLGHSARQLWCVQYQQARHLVAVTWRKTDALTAQWFIETPLGNHEITLQPSVGGVVVWSNGTRRMVECVLEHDRVALWHGADRLDVVVEDPRVIAPQKTAVEASLIARLPGRVVSVEVSAGESVKAGHVLLVLEAMKMEQAIRAPTDGVVLRLLYAEGEQVPQGAALVEFERPAQPGAAT
jgi:3-methylcrotonyl-CoA carboxylase alpha subunit